MCYFSQSSLHLFCFQDSIHTTLGKSPFLVVYLNVNKDPLYMSETKLIQDFFLEFSFMWNFPSMKNGVASEMLVWKEFSVLVT